MITARLGRRPCVLDETQKPMRVAGLDSSRHGSTKTKTCRAPIAGIPPRARAARRDATARVEPAHRALRGRARAPRRQEAARLVATAGATGSARACSATRRRRIDTDEERARARARVWRRSCRRSSERRQGSRRRARAGGARPAQGRARADRTRWSSGAIRSASIRCKGERGRHAAGALAVLGRLGTLEPDEARQARDAGQLQPARRTTAVDGRAARGVPRARRCAHLPAEPDERARAPRAEPARARRVAGLAAACAARSTRSSRTRSRASRVHRYFQELVPGDRAPRVVTTIELGLQRRCAPLLERAMVTQRPALAMAIAIDVATGDVLAVDAVDPYGMGGFLPTHPHVHARLDVQGRRDGDRARGGRRHARRAASTRTTASSSSRAGRSARPRARRTRTGSPRPQGLAYSINAVLVQIGTRMSDEALRGHLVGSATAGAAHRARPRARRHAPRAAVEQEYTQASM